MPVSNMKASFNGDVKTVWNIVTSLTDYRWRSDLRKIEILNENQFIEYSKDGTATTFTVTACEPLKRWEFDMKNDNMEGHWVGIFAEKHGQTEIDFTEDVTAKKPLPKFLVKAFLKKQQKQYAADLKRILE